MCHCRNKIITIIIIIISEESDYITALVRAKDPLDELGLPTDIKAENQAIEYAIKLMDQTPCDLCAMLTGIHGVNPSSTCTACFCVIYLI